MDGWMDGRFGLVYLFVISHVRLFRSIFARHSALCRRLLIVWMSAHFTMNYRPHSAVFSRGVPLRSEMEYLGQIISPSLSDIQANRCLCNADRR